MGGRKSWKGGVVVVKTVMLMLKLMLKVDNWLSGTELSFVFGGGAEEYPL